MCVSGFRGRAEGGCAYKGQVAEEHSLLYSLINARRKDDGQPLSDLHICAQAFTFVLAGQYYSHSFGFHGCYILRNLPKFHEERHTPCQQGF